jgi:DNA-binding NtrC family response regulator
LPVPLLAEHFLARAAHEAREPVSGLQAAARAKLLEYSWPGNVRDLQNVTVRAVCLCRGTQILPAHIDCGATDPPADREMSDEDAAFAGLDKLIRWACGTVTRDPI